MFLFLSKIILRIAPADGNQVDDNRNFEKRISIISKSRMLLNTLLYLYPIQTKTEKELRKNYIYKYGPKSDKFCCPYLQITFQWT